MPTQFYRAKDPRTGGEVFKEVGTDRYIGPTEFKKGGFIEKPTTIVKTPTPAQQQTNTGMQAYIDSPLGDYKEKQKFLDYTKGLLQKAQGENKDIQAAKNYWRARESDPMTFTDERLQLLDPTTQQNLREKSYATAKAQLYGLGEEEKYRGQRVEDVVGSIEKAQKAKTAETDAEIARGNKSMNDIKDLYSLGIQPTDDQFNAAGIPTINGRTGGTASWRNNNPGNIKFGDFAKKYGAVQGTKATDGGYFAYFPDETTGAKARQDLLQTSRYTNLPLDYAMKVYSGGVSTKPTREDSSGFMVEGLGKRYISNNGYDYAKLITLGAPAVNKPLSEFTESELAMLESAQRKAEGWTEGTILSPGAKDTGIKITDDAKKKIMKLAGITNADVQAAGGFSADDWMLMETAGKEAVMSNATASINDMKSKGTSPEKTKAAIVRLYGDLLDADEINSLMTTAGSTSTTVFNPGATWGK